MGFDFVVLGATGLQGKIASRYLLESGYSVLLCGRNKERVKALLDRYKKSGFGYIDLGNIDKTIEVIKSSGADTVLNCAEGDWNLNALKACVNANANCLDLGSEIWMTKKQLKMHSILKEKNLIHITGCGSVPGIGNVMLRYASEKFKKIKTIEVGFAWDSNIKKFVVPFSIQSIIEEFTELATVVKNGKFIKVRPMDTVFDSYDRFIGTEKCFYVKHPETYTFYHYFKKKGVKNIGFFAEFPLHSFEKIMAMIELGFGSKKEIDFKGIKIKPVEFLTEVLKELKMPKNYKEKEDIWVKIIGDRKNERKKIIKMSCLVSTLKGWEDAGCNIDTGMTIGIIAIMIKNGLINEKGSFAPEAIVPPEAFFKELKKEKINVFENGKLIN